MRRTALVPAMAAFFISVMAPVAVAAEDPVGIWNLTIGPRNVLIKVDRTDGKLTAKIGGGRRDLRDVDSIAFDNDVLKIDKR